MRFKSNLIILNKNISLSRVFRTNSESFIVVTQFLLESSHVLLRDHLLYRHIALTINNVVSGTAKCLNFMSSHSVIHLFLEIDGLPLSSFFCVLISKIDGVDGSAIAVNGHFRSLFELF